MTNFILFKNIIQFHFDLWGFTIYLNDKKGENNVVFEMELFPLFFHYRKNIHPNKNREYYLYLFFVALYVELNYLSNKTLPVKEQQVFLPVNQPVCNLLVCKISSVPVKKALVVLNESIISNPSKKSK